MWEAGEAESEDEEEVEAATTAEKRKQIWGVSEAADGSSRAPLPPRHDHRMLE